MQIDIRKYPNYRKFSGLALVVAGILFLLPRMIGGGDVGPSPAIGIMFIIFGAVYIRGKSESSNGT